MKERWEVTGKPCLICRSHSGSTIGNRKEMWFGNFPLSLAEQREEWMPECFTQERKRCCLHAFRWISCPPPACGCGRESCVCLCVCTWNVRVTLCTHWWSSTEKRKLPAMLLMLINSLQLCNGTMIIIKSHAWRLQGQEKTTPSMPPSVHAPNTSGAWQGSLFIFYELRHVEDIGNTLPACACEDSFAAWGHTKPAPRFWKPGNIQPF